MSLIRISLVVLIYNKWTLRVTSLDNPLKPLLGLLISNHFLSIGLLVVGLVYSRVALEATLNKVGSVLAI